MTISRINPFTRALVLTLLVQLAACGMGPSEPGRFYVLSTPSSLDADSAAKNKNLSIGVGPVTLPPHLDRTQIVTQASQHQLALNEFDQWAEPLKDGFTRVLAQNLAVLMGIDNVLQFPWRRPFSVQYQVSVEVIRFDTDATGRSVLSARWNIVTGDGQALLFSHSSTIRSQAEGTGFEPVVAAMSLNLAELSREIATAIHTFK